MLGFEDLRTAVWGGGLLFLLIACFLPQSQDNFVRTTESEALVRSAEVADVFFSFLCRGDGKRA